MAQPALTSSEEGPLIQVSRPYAWLVFAVTFGLLISDYMSRQVLTAVFPLLKAEWRLSDAGLGGLAGAVALMVGVLTFPLSLVADRWGRVKSIGLMAVVWSLATLACGLARSYDQMLAARFCVGVGEAAYGSVGAALVLSLFPANLRATLTAAFMAGGMFGQVLGMAIGGALAASLGWRWSFAAMAAFGLALAVVFLSVVRPRRFEAASTRLDVQKGAAPLKSLVGSRTVIAAYVGSGLQLFVAAAVLAWIPSFLNRAYGLPPGRAAGLAAAFVLASGVGMVVCGRLSDRLGHGRPQRKIRLAIGFCAASLFLFGLAFRLPTGLLQLTLLAGGLFVAAGTSGPAGAMVANLTHPAVRGAAFATLTLANNLLGLAPGPFVAGLLADRFSLTGALQLVPLVSLAAGAAFHLAGRRYAADLERARGACGLLSPQVA